MKNLQKQFGFFQFYRRHLPEGDNDREEDRGSWLVHHPPYYCKIGVTTHRHATYYIMYFYLFFAAAFLFADVIYQTLFCLFELGLLHDAAAVIDHYFTL